MLNLTLKNVLANKARLILTTLAVTLGVSFVVSTFVLSDSLQKSFDNLAANVVEGTDLAVRPADTFGTDGALTTETLDIITSVDGVAAAAGGVGSEDVELVRSSGDVVSGETIGLNWVDEPALSTFNLVEGDAPGEGEFVMSSKTANDDGFVIGETYSIVAPGGTVERTLSGLVAFDLGDDADFDIPVTFTLVPLGDAQALFGTTADGLESISISVAGDALAENVQADIAAALNDDALEVINQRTIQDEQAAGFNEIISIMRNVLLGFAVIALFVSTFIIYNTFGIILTQRIRELGLLRAIGAGENQIRQSVIGEAVVIGLIASVTGIIAGLGLNSGLQWLFSQLGSGLPANDTVIAPRTIILAFVIGLGVTLISSVGPARKAARVSPVTAMNGTSTQDTQSRLRVLVGTAVLAAGVALGAVGLFVASGTATIVASLGLALVAVFMGVTLLSPVLTGPIISALGFPARQVGGVSGALANDNAKQNPRRTSTTAAALMIGLSLITTVLVVGESAKAHIGSTLDRTVTADFVVSNDFDPMGVEVFTAMTEIDEIDNLVVSSEVDVRTGGEVIEATTISMGTVGRLFDLGIVEGDYGDAGSNAAVFSEDRAAELGLSVGDSTSIEFENGTTSDFVVTGIYNDTTLIDSGILLDGDHVQALYPTNTIEFVAAKVAADTTSTAANTALDALSTEFPQVSIQTSTEYREQIEGEIDQVLVIVNALLGLAIFIALIGIGLTLALSVSERTREIGLLRAIGMSRRQLRRMVRWEAALIAVFGAVLGVAIGLVFGSATVTALPASITSAIAVPGGQLVLLILVSGVAGLVAALLPARRAARMDVLTAINS